MTLLDTNVLVYASDPGSEFSRWARKAIARAVRVDGAAINAVTLAELCVGSRHPETVADRIRTWGVVILDVPAAASDVCAKAYNTYRKRRLRQSGKDSPAMPLPDFFIGAHAQTMGWRLATADQGRFKTYFPRVVVECPSLKTGMKTGTRARP